MATFTLCDGVSLVENRPCGWQANLELFPLPSNSPGKGFTVVLTRPEDTAARLLLIPGGWEVHPLAACDSADTHTALWIAEAVLRAVGKRGAHRLNLITASPAHAPFVRWAKEKGLHVSVFCPHEDAFLETLLAANETQPIEPLYRPVRATNNLER